MQMNECAESMQKNFSKAVLSTNKIMSMKYFAEVCKELDLQKYIPVNWNLDLMQKYFAYTRNYFVLQKCENDATRFSKKKVESHRIVKSGRKSINSVW